VISPTHSSTPWREWRTGGISGVVGNKPIPAGLRQDIVNKPAQLAPVLFGIWDLQRVVRHQRYSPPRARKSIVGNRVEQTGDQVILLNYRRAAPRSGGRATNLPRPFPKTDLASKSLVPIGTKRQNEVAYHYSCNFLLAHFVDF
jgi:hypothetical protein